MINIYTKKLKEADLREIAEFTLTTLQSSVFKSDGRTLEDEEEELREASDSDDQVIIIAREDDGGKIVGTLSLYTGFPEMAFIAEWNPYIVSGSRWETIGSLLINECKKYIQTNGFHRVEVSLSPILSSYDEILEEYHRLFESCGFYRATRETTMQVDLSSFTLPDQIPILPDGFEFEEIGNRDIEEIREVFMLSFRNGRDRLFLDMTESQQETSFKYWFDQKIPLHPASTLVVKDNRIIGFGSVKPKEKIVTVSSFGIIPEYRGKGIANSIMYRIIHLLQEDNIKIAELEADIDNTPAIKLYTKFGFISQYEQEYYAWRTG